MWRMSEQRGVDVENERAEWMWRMTERSRVDVKNERAECMWTITKKLWLSIRTLLGSTFLRKAIEQLILNLNLQR